SWFLGPGSRGSIDRTLFHGYPATNKMLILGYSLRQTPPPRKPSPIPSSTGFSILTGREPASFSWGPFRVMPVGHGQPAGPRLLSRGLLPGGDPPGEAMAPGSRRLARRGPVLATRQPRTATAGGILEESPSRCPGPRRCAGTGSRTTRRGETSTPSRSL